MTDNKRLTLEELHRLPVFGQDGKFELNRDDCRTWVCPKCNWLVDIPWEFAGLVKCGLDPTFLPRLYLGEYGLTPCGFINCHNRCTMGLVIVGDEKDTRYEIDLLDYVLDEAEATP